MAEAASVSRYSKPPPPPRNQKKPFREQSDYQILLHENHSPRHAKAALTKNPDLNSARKWLETGGFEEENDDNLHGRFRKASHFDPNLADKVTDAKGILKSDLAGDLNEVSTPKPDFVKFASVGEDTHEVREMARKGFQEYSGKLEKNSPSNWAGWQSRWFYLWENKLEYYKEKTPVQKGSIDLLQVRAITISEEDPRKFDIEVFNEGKSRIYQLRGSDANDVLQWVNALLANRCRAIKVGITAAPDPVEDTIELNKLHFKANTGDVLLFCSQNTGGYIVQSATGGKYDHIGVLIRHAPNQVCVLEALGRHGVQLYKWEDFIKEKWYTQYKSMALRRLHVPNRTLRKEVVLKIVNFVKEVVNCEYSWTPMKMMRRESTADQPLKDRSYFCSELVAKSYKLSGILRENCPSSAYTPAMFGDKHDLHLLKGANLLPEQIITFEGD